MGREEFSQRYDELYAKACALFKKHNPCEIRRGSCMRGRIHEIKSFCCGSCEHLSNTGCTVKCLWCKLWVCHDIDNAELIEGLQAIENEAGEWGMLGYRSTKKEMMRRCYGIVDGAVQLWRA